MEKENKKSYADADGCSPKLLLVRGREESYKPAGFTLPDSRNLTSNSHRNTTNKQTINKQTRKMRNYLLLCCTLGLSCAAPQTYSEQAAPLSDDTFATIQEVFGTSEKQVDA